MYNKEELDGFARKAMPILKQHGYLESKVTENSKVKWISPLVFFVIGMLFCGIMIYGIDKGSFKSEFNQEIDPNVSVSIDNQYDFDPVTENEYEISNNHTIINNVIIPSDICGGATA